MQKLPQIFHFVWVGDAAQEPVAAIDTWRQHHPDWEVRVYRNDDVFKNGALNGREWRHRRLIDAFAARGEYCGVADLVRWEMLWRDGGIALDADFICFAPLPQWLLDCEIAAAWACEDNPEGDLLSNGFVSAMPQHSIIGAVQDRIETTAARLTRWSWSRMKRKNIGAWKTVGPTPFTQVVKETRFQNFTALPSHFFMPVRRDGSVYSGGGPVLGEQLWASSYSINDRLQDVVAERLAKHAEAAAQAAKEAEEPRPAEVDGPKGPEPTRYGDWEVGGRCSDF